MGSGRSVIADLGSNDLIAGAGPAADIEPGLGALVSSLADISSPAAVQPDGTVVPGLIAVYLTAVAPDAAITLSGFGSLISRRPSESL